MLYNYIEAAAIKKNQSKFQHFFVKVDLKNIRSYYKGLLDTVDQLKSRPLPILKSLMDEVHTQLLTNYT